MPRVLVIGQGNVLLGDEALGPEVIRVLESRYQFPDDVRLLEIGTQGLNLVPFLEGAEALVSVNSLHGKGVPGEVRFLDRAAVMRDDPEYRMSPHAFGMKGHLESLEFAGSGPRQVFVLGAIPEDVELGVGLSRTMKEAVPKVVAELIALLRRLGVEATERKEPLALRRLWDESP